MESQTGVKTDLMPRERIAGIASVAGLVLVLALFQLITIGSAVIAPGAVVVQGNPRPVQSLEGGVLREILVRNGDTVEAGEIVMRLDPTLAGINRDIVRGRLAELVARGARLEAERDQRAGIELDGDLVGDLVEKLDPATIQQHLAGQYEVLRSRRAVLESRRAQLKEQIEQYGAQSTGIEAQIEAAENQVALISREVGNLETLFSQGLVPESRLLELQGRKAGLLGQIASYRSELSRLRNAVRDAELEIIQVGQEFRDEVVEELREVSTLVGENTLELARVDETLSRLAVRAPVAGVVHELQVWTNGGVIAPQETLLTVVPVSEGLEFQVEVSPDAIDTVHLGQAARVRFPAFDQRSTPELSGTVSGISPDSVTDPATNRAFYRVDVALPQDELARLGAAELIPGMPVEAFLQTGERSILNLLIKPLTDQLTYAFREG